MALLAKELSQMMMEKLLTLPPKTTKLKEQVYTKLRGFLLLAANRNVIAAWKKTKKEAIKLYPDKFILDEKEVLHWNDGSVLDKKISTTNFKKLNKLAKAEGVDVNKIVTKLINVYKKRQN
ncbi:MAG: hypothetical protein AB8G86_27560 [Saprospiraceae bacterium]